MSSCGQGDGRTNRRAAVGGNADLRPQIAWYTLKTGRRDFEKVVVELNASKLVGEGGVLERGLQALVTHRGYFRPSANAFLSDSRANNRQYAKN